MSLILFGGIGVALVWWCYSYAYPVYECHFCGARTKRRRLRNMSWTCDVCENLNGFDEDGDYLTPPRNMFGEAPAVEPRGADEQERTSGGGGGGFNGGFGFELCRRCNDNQRRIVDAMRDCQGDNPSEIDAFRASLERQYPLCRRCESGSRRAIADNDDRVRDIHLDDPSVRAYLQRMVVGVFPRARSLARATFVAHVLMLLLVGGLLFEAYNGGRSIPVVKRWLFTRLKGHVDADVLEEHFPEFSVDSIHPESIHFSHDPHFLRHLESATFQVTPVQVDMRTLTDDQRKGFKKDGYFREAVSDECLEYGSAPSIKALSSRISAAGKEKKQRGWWPSPDSVDKFRCDDFREFYNDGKMCFEKLSTLRLEKDDERRRREQFEKMKSDVRKRVERQRDGADHDGGRRRGVFLRTMQEAHVDTDDEALRQEKEAGDRARRQAEEDAKIAARWNPWLRELSLYVAVLLALVELARALHVWWRTRLVRPLYEAHYIDHHNDEGVGTYTRYDRTAYFGRSPYARVLPAIVSREGVVVLVVALVFADAFLSLCALAPHMRVNYGFLVAAREWLDERAEGYEVYQRYIRIGIFVFQLFRVAKAMRALWLENEDGGRRFNYERHESDSSSYYHRRRSRRRRRSSGALGGQGGDSSSRSNSPFSASPDSARTFGSLDDFRARASAPSRTPSPPPYSYQGVDSTNPHSFRRGRDHQDPFHSGSGFSSFSEMFLPSSSSRRSNSMASQHDAHRELFPNAYERKTSSSSGGSGLRHRPASSGASRDDRRSRDSRGRDRPMHPLANDDRFYRAGFSVSDTGSSGAYPYHYGTGYQSVPRGTGRPSSARRRRSSATVPMEDDDEVTDALNGLNLF